MKFSADTDKLDIGLGYKAITMQCYIIIIVPLIDGTVAAVKAQYVMSLAVEIPAVYT